MVFSEVSARSDNYGGQAVTVRNGRAGIILVPVDGGIEIRLPDHAIIARFTTDAHGGRPTLETASHDFVTVV